MSLESVWIQMAMLFALEKQSLSVDKYCLAVAQMANLKMDFITINSPVLLALSKIDNWTVNEKFKSTLKTLGQKNVEIASALNVAMEFLSTIWNYPLANQKKESFLYATLTALRAWRSPYIIKYVLSISIFFQSYKQLLFINAVRKWCKGHFVDFPIPNQHPKEQLQKNRTKQMLGIMLGTRKARKQKRP
jgi:hypothetical protein